MKINPSKYDILLLAKFKINKCAMQQKVWGKICVTLFFERSRNFRLWLFLNAWIERCKILQDFNAKIMSDFIMINFFDNFLKDIEL